ncbi:SdiA-regulated domain-containing protein [Pseudomonas sp. 5P_3.1_Bac2]|uniref:SdiA-regulated domain-containing protein n=1 Tax=Pseudomonas sp. 5P_3.1_Bac2 TaxID=2971617 RepID=UPI0021CA4088|nr:SdiA-regulated domain-containing protein [Pseudomonas sp. 5P_3.1_Bac2]MCU1718035.1 SdiA-regulated domain-containing protein [Pseudomonas sp. 5P_3.1_Bac2]
MPGLLRTVLRRRWWLALAVVLAGLLYAMVARHLDDRLWFWLHEIQVQPSEQQASIWLPGYKAVLQGKPLQGLEDDELSGLTYNPQTNTLFTVTGKHPQIIELSLTGVVLRRIDVHGLSNPEGVEMISGGRLAVIDERQHTLTTFKINELTHSLEAADNPSYELGFADAGNKGFEGIAWDPVHKRVLLGKERDPMGLFSLPFPGDEGGPGKLETLPSSKLFLRDISSLTYDARTGHSLVLSDESRLLLEVDAKGRPISFISLARGMNGLRGGIAQAEGVTMDAEGNIYIVSEPNLFYVLHKDKEPTPAP